MKIQSLEELFINGLNYAYDAEKQLLEAQPQLAQAASNPQLRQAFEQHLNETQQQVSRLERIFQHNGKTTGNKA